MASKNLSHRFFPFLLLITSVLFCGFDFSPDKWFRDITKMWERTKPSVENVTFWDFNNNTERGIRAFLYTVPKDRPNRMVDLRLHRKMTQFLSYICYEVITLDALEGSPYQFLLEKQLDRMVNEWKFTGKVNTEKYNAAMENYALAMQNDDRNSPLIDFDLLVFIERIHYDQRWRGNQKLLVIGVSAAAFEMDLGIPLYQDRIMVESPWDGEKGTYNKAEHAALLKVADEMGLAIQKAANEINQKHVQLEKEQLLARIQEEKARQEEILNQTRDLQELVQQTEALLNQEEAPGDLASSLAFHIQSLKPLLEKSPPKSPHGKKSNGQASDKNLTQKDIETRATLAQSILDDLKTWDTWKKQQEELQKQKEIANQPSLREQSASLPQQQIPGQTTLTPGSQNPLSNMVGIPIIDSPQSNIYNREWLRPSSAAIKPGTVPITNTTGVIRRPDIQSSQIDRQVPKNFHLLQNQYFPPMPDAAAPQEENAPANSNAQQ